jgi:aquaporin Z
MAGICAFAASSGAHFNPTVTIGFFLAKRFPFFKVPLYLGAQCAGAIAASAVLGRLFPSDATLGATVPSDSWQVAFGFEVVLTFFLVSVILHATRGGGAFGALAPFAIGGTVAMDALVGGPISGASMNPARSLGPALLSGVWSHHWIYWMAPLLGCVLAALLDHFFPHLDPAIL